LKEESLSLEVFRENRTPIAFFLAKTKIYTISSENTKFLSFSLADYISKISEGFALFSRKNKSQWQGKRNPPNLLLFQEMAVATLEMQTGISGWPTLSNLITKTLQIIWR
jgi:hypothetical protein